HPNDEVKGMLQHGGERLGGIFGNEQAEYLARDAHPRDENGRQHQHRNDNLQHIGCLRHISAKHILPLLVKKTHFFPLYSSAALHSAPRNPTRTASSATTSGRFTSIPCWASKANCSASVMEGSFSFRPKPLYKRPLVLKKRRSGRPLFACQARSSSS